MSIINKIEILLNKNGKNQKALMDFLCVGEPVYTKWKTGNSKSYNKYIDKIAEYFGVTTDYLLGSENNLTQQPADEFEDKIIILARNKGKQLDSKDKEKLIKIFESTLDTFLESKDK